MASLTVDGDQIARFHAALFKHASPTAYVSLRGFPDTETGPPYVIDAAVNGSAVAKAITIAQQCANASTPIVFAPPVATFDTPDSAAYAHMVDGLVLSVECDQNPGQSLITLEAILGPATLVVASGGRTAAGEDKLHLHWRLKRPTRQAIEHQKLRQARKAAALLVGADKTNITPVHPIRWPGSYHRKGEPRLAQIIAEHDTEIDLDQAFETLETACELAGIPIDPPRAPSIGASEAPIEDLAAAMALIPNSEETPWDEFNAWGMALYAATGGSADGYAIFDEWASRSLKYDSETVLARWEHYPSSPPTDTGAGKIFAAARAAVPGWREPSRGDIMAGFEPVTPSRAPQPLPAVLNAGLDDDPIQPRQWLLGNTFARGYLSSLVAAGATGKTSVRIAQALAMATGRPLTGEKVHHRSRVLIISLEDDMDELRRRVRAARIHYGISGAEIDGWLFLTCPLGQKIALLDPSGRVVEGPLADLIREQVRVNGIDVVSLDPAVKAHGVDENDNNQMDAVATIITRLAIQLNISIDVPHHTSKGVADAGNADRSRGASAFVNAGRLVYTLNTMTSEEAERLGVKPEVRRSLVRMDSAKANIAPASEQAAWFKLTSTEIGNSTQAYPAGDHVQVAVPWSPLTVNDLVPHHIMVEVLKDLRDGLADGSRYSTGPAAGDRAAWRVISNHCPTIEEVTARYIIKDMLTSKVISEEEYYDKKQRKNRKGVVVFAGFDAVE